MDVEGSVRFFEDYHSNSFASSLLGLLFGPKIGDSVFLPNVGKLIPL
jgi:hypothetical protein